MESSYFPPLPDVSRRASATSDRCACPVIVSSFAKLAHAGEAIKSADDKILFTARKSADPELPQVKHAQVKHAQDWLKAHSLQPTTTQ